MKKNCIVYLLVTMALILSLTACQSEAPAGSDPTPPVSSDPTPPVSSDPTPPVDNNPVVAETIEKASLTDEEKAWLVQNLNTFAFQSAPVILTNVRIP